MKHKITMTYNPKLDRVFNGEITQTIRKGCKFNIGDHVLIHEWQGKPYRSPWGRRLEVVLTNVYNIWVYNEGFQARALLDSDDPELVPKRHNHVQGWQSFRLQDIYDYTFIGWGTSIADYLAKLDGIDPPTGFELAKVLRELNRSNLTGEYQIIKWEFKTEETP